jgi:hypothetical protein
VLGTGLHNPPAIRIWTGTVGLFGSRPVSSILRFRIAGCKFMVAFRYVTVDHRILISVSHSPFSMYWPPYWSKRIETHTRPHPENACQLSVINFGSCISGYMSGVWSQECINNINLAIMSQYVRNIPATSCRTITTDFIYGATTKYP